MSKFVRTETILDKILDNTASEVKSQKKLIPLSVVRKAAESASSPRDMIAALRRETVALIAEVKHASPSRGVLIEDFDPVRLATLYEQNGASAISVLTDQKFFKGSLDYLKAIRAAVDLPLLRKDFIIDAYQVYEGRVAGVDAMLLITAALSDSQLADLHALISELGMTPLVEVHNEAELDRALKVDPVLIGVNNRDLKTFDVDLNTTARLIKRVPGDVTFVAESGVKMVDHVRQMGELGSHAILVGEGLVTAGNIGEQVRAFSSVKRGKRSQ